MKTWILRASTLVFAAGVMGTLACGASSSGCGGTNLNSNGPGINPVLSCGAGTVLNGSTQQCVPGTP